MTMVALALLVFVASATISYCATRQDDALRPPVRRVAAANWGVLSWMGAIVGFVVAVKISMWVLIVEGLGLWLGTYVASGKVRGDRKVTKMSETSEIVDVTFTKHDAYITDVPPGGYTRLVRKKGSGDVAWAAWCCPACEEALLIMRGRHEVDVYGVVTPALRCPTKSCGFMAKVFLDGWVPEGRATA